ncbi:hypothetical protein OG223_29255 [Streptomyces sp. NBC_01478]|uniref:hypothetical protein n=1 Tax=Streptomyces sp. NBC_01478 TaxID=2903882 RepID=UPI002E325E13|nr:hypothetical protein [Streptomyces sp. NBC_01478]
MSARNSQTHADGEVITDASSLVEVVLGDASARRGPAKHYNPGDAQVSVESQGSFSRNPKDASKGLIACRDRYTAELINSDGDRIAVIKASFVAAFSVVREEDPDEAELEKFANSTGRLVIRPYAREFIQQLSTRMGIPAFLLEVLRFHGSVVEEDASEVSGAVSEVGT